MNHTTDELVDSQAGDAVTTQRGRMSTAQTGDVDHADIGCT